MLDVLDFIEDKGGDLKKVQESQKRRYAPPDAAEEVVALYEDARKTKYAASQLRQKVNSIQKEVGVRKKAKENADELLRQKTDVEKEMKISEDAAVLKEDHLRRKLKAIGNYVHASVPISDNEDDNALIRKWTPDGETMEKRECLSHHEVLSRIGGYDPERGQKIVGHRGFFLTGPGVRLNLALISYGLEFLENEGYTPIETPHFMFQDVMAKTAQLEQFDDELYKVTEDENKKETDKYLIATSEQPLSAMHAGEWLQAKDLPIRYAGHSTCYRKEAGAHGKDAWGIFRVHQFDKIEQFIFTRPEDSWETFDQMIALSERFYKTLGLPYQVVAIVSGALNNAAAKKYDLEAWFPYQQAYKELVSCSNCTDYQARDLDIRYGAKQQTEPRKKYVHALNSTLCATQRTLCCVLENYQTDEGVRVPNVLRKYMGGKEFISFIKDLPKDSTSYKVKGKGAGPASVNATTEKIHSMKV